MDLLSSDIRVCVPLIGLLSSDIRVCLPLIVLLSSDIEMLLYSFSGSIELGYSCFVSLIVLLSSVIRTCFVLPAFIEMCY